MTQIAIFVFKDNCINILLEKTDSTYQIIGKDISIQEDKSIDLLSCVDQYIGGSSIFTRHIAVFDDRINSDMPWVINNLFYGVVREEDLTLYRGELFAIATVATLDITPFQRELIDKAIVNIRKDLLETFLAQYFLPKYFTIAMLQTLLMQVSSSKEITRTHFYTKMKNARFLQPVLDSSDQHLVIQRPNVKRPAKLYQFKPKDIEVSVYF